MQIPVGQVGLSQAAPKFRAVGVVIAMNEPDIGRRSNGIKNLIERCAAYHVAEQDYRRRSLFHDKFYDMLEDTMRVATDEDFFGRHVFVSDSSAISGVSQLPLAFCIRYRFANRSSKCKLIGNGVMQCVMICQS